MGRKKMRLCRLVFAASAAVAVFANSVFAADLIAPRRDNNWTGFYAGVNGGLGFGQNNWNAPSLGFTSPSGNFSGMLGGVTVGANWQSSAWVYGLEGDMDVAGLLSSDPASVVFTCGVSCNTAVGSLGTLRVRIGHELGTRAMVYATGGLAGGWVHAYDPLVLGGADLGSATQIGWTAGGGIEAAPCPTISASRQKHCMLVSVAYQSQIALLVAQRT